MFDWNDIRYFLAIHRAGNLARAGEALQVDATTVGRRLEKLEDALATRLFDRSSRGLTLTAAGRRLIPRAEGIEREALALDRDLAGDDAKLEGAVRLTATETLATRFIAPFLGRFHARHPGIRLELVCTNRDLDLARREADIALRLTRPRQEDLVVKRLLSIELALYAAHEYVARQGMPAPGGLSAHRFLLFADTPAFARENAWLMPYAEQGEIALRSDSVSSIVSAAAGGMGIALLPVHVGDREAALVRTPLPGSPQPRAVWQAVHRDLLGSARIRAVLDFLGRLFAPRKSTRASGPR